MKILWLVSTTLPAAAAACGLPGQSDVSGGWLAGQLDALRRTEVPPELTICSVDSRAQKLRIGTADGVKYVLLPTGDESTLSALLNAEMPRLVHIWGTEYPAAAVMQQTAAAQGLPVLVGVQGVMRDCAAHLLDGVPESYRTSCKLQRIIDRVVPGALLDKSQAQFDRAAAAEASMLQRAVYVTGRTAYDRAAMAELAPGARYFACNETLRPEFFCGGETWRPHNFGSVPVIFLSQGNYPLKNLHTVLRAMPAVLQRWPGAMLCIAGWPPLDKGPLLRPIIDWMFPYQRWCRSLIDELGLAGHVQYTGPLDAAAMKNAYLGADVFVLPSFCENSPNSLGEAMLLGVPCVVSRAGGIPDMADDGVQAVCYGDPGDAAALSQALTAVLSDPTRAASMGRAARARALRTHDGAANAAVMTDIYRTILGEAAHD